MNENTQFCGNCGAQLKKEVSEVKSKPLNASHHKWKPIILIAIAALVIWGCFIRESPKEIAYNCVKQTIEENLYVASFPKYSSNKITVSDMHTTKIVDGTKFKIYDVRGEYVANSILGLTPTIDYKAEVGLYKNGTLFYCSFYDGMILDLI